MLIYMPIEVLFCYQLTFTQHHFLHNSPTYTIIPHQVARLYRKSLKTLSSWVIDRDIFLEEATNLRSRFDSERGCSNAKAVRLLKVRVIDAI